MSPIKAKKQFLAGPLGNVLLTIGTENAILTRKVVLPKGKESEATTACGPIACSEMRGAFELRERDLITVLNLTELYSDWLVSSLWPIIALLARSGPYASEWTSVLDCTLPVLLVQYIDANHWRELRSVGR